MHIVKIPFNKPFMVGKELEYLRQAYNYKHLSGGGFFTKKCQSWIERQTNCSKALLTHSCTAALEMAAILADIQAGDEIIMPSYTFTSTANAFVLRGAIPVFVDIRPDTLNIDEDKIEYAITSRTRAIVPVHYAGVACNMDTILAIGKDHDLFIIEDAAQSVMSKYRGHPLGSLGHFAALSFHETKNIISGEGGAILINDPNFIKHAEIIWEKGTNRTEFFRKEIDQYTWVDIGSSYLPSELTASFLWAQMEAAEFINKQRLRVWNQYHHSFAQLEEQGKIRRPIIPDECAHNAHMYYLLLSNLEERNHLIATLKTVGINTVFHYVSLHNSPAGIKYTRSHGDFQNTQKANDCLVRLPLWVGMTDEHVQFVVRSIYDILK